MQPFHVFRWMGIGGDAGGMNDGRLYNEDGSLDDALLDDALLADAPLAIALLDLVLFDGGSFGAGLLDERLPGDRLVEDSSVMGSIILKGRAFLDLGMLLLFVVVESSGSFEI